MVCRTSEKFETKASGMDRGNFGKRFQAALIRRLSPNTTLHPDQLAYAIGYEGRSVRNWLRGSHQPNGDAIGACVQFFALRDDPMFLVEIYGDAAELVLKRHQRGEKAINLLEGMAEFLKESA